MSHSAAQRQPHKVSCIEFCATHPGRIEGPAYDPLYMVCMVVLGILGINFIGPATFFAIFFTPNVLYSQPSRMFPDLSLFNS